MSPTESDRDFATSVAIETTPEIIRELKADLKRSGIATSLPVPAQSPSDALDSPLGPDEIRQTLEVLVVLLNAGSAAVTFSEKLVAALKKHREATATLTDASTGKQLCQLDGDSTVVDVRITIKK
jgi:hypothetical protein